MQQVRLLALRAVGKVLSMFLESVPPVAVLEPSPIRTPIRIPFPTVITANVPDALLHTPVHAAIRTLPVPSTILIITFPKAPSTGTVPVPRRSTSAPVAETPTPPERSTTPIPGVHGRPPRQRPVPKRELRSTHAPAAPFLRHNPSPPSVMVGRSVPIPGPTTAPRASSRSDAPGTAPMSLRRRSIPHVVSWRIPRSGPHTHTRSRERMPRQASHSPIRRSATPIVRF